MGSSNVFFNLYEHIFVLKSIIKYYQAKFYSVFSIRMYYNLKILEQRGILLDVCCMKNGTIIYQTNVFQYDLTYAVLTVLKCMEKFDKCFVNLGRYMVLFLLTWSTDRKLQVMI